MNKEFNFILFLASIRWVLSMGLDVNGFVEILANIKDGSIEETIPGQKLIISSNDDYAVERKGMTKYLELYNSETETKPPKYIIANDKNVSDFMMETYKRTLSFFDTIEQEKYDETISKKILSAKKKFDNLFYDFIKKNKDRAFRTNVGRQRVILHTVDTASDLARRLINRVITRTEESLRNTKKIKKAMLKKLNNQISSNYEEACKQYNVCRTKSTYTYFVYYCLLTLVKLNDTALHQSFEKIFDRMADRDVNIVIDDTSKAQMIANLKFWLRDKDDVLRLRLELIQDMILDRVRIALIPETMFELRRRAYATVDFLNILDKLIDANSENKLEWDDMQKMVTEYVSGQREDLLEITDMFLDNFLRNAEILRKESRLGVLQTKLEALIAS